MSQESEQIPPVDGARPDRTAAPGQNEPTPSAPVRPPDRTAAPAPDLPPEPVRIHTDFITLQDLLKLTGAVDTGGEAKIRIQNCEAEVNRSICTQRGKKLRPGDTVLFHGRRYVVAHGK